MPRNKIEDVIGYHCSVNNLFKKYLTSPVINAWGSKIQKKHFRKPPILIGGCGRSGTTLLLAIISAHPAIFAFPHEVDAFTEWERVDGKLKPTRIDRMNRHLIRTSIPHGVTRWCEKRPYNVLHIPEILAYHGTGTKFIHLVRDPRAVCTSKHPEKPGEYWVPIERWINDTGTGLAHINNPQVLTIKYEDLILETDRLIKELCDFIEEDLTPEIISWYDHATVRKNRAWFDGLKNIQPESLTKWQKPENQVRVEEIIANPQVKNLMEQLGYHESS